MNQFDAFFQVCARRLEFNLPLKIALYRTESIYKTLKDLAPDMDLIIPSVRFNGIATLAWPIYTEEGLCYIFNSLNSNEIYSDEYELKHNFKLMK